MSEEIKDLAVVVARAVMYTILTNNALGFGKVLALLFSVGDIEPVASSPVSLADYPFIQIYYNAVEYFHGSNAMNLLS